MENLLLEIGLFENISLLEILLKDKKVHLVCMASKDPSSHFFRLIDRFAPPNIKAKFDETVDLINHSSEVASLYPGVYLSFLPQLNYNEMENTHKHERVFNELIFNANEELIKKERMVILLDQEYLDYNRAAELIKKSVLDNGNLLKWLRHITLM